MMTERVLTHGELEAEIASMTEALTPAVLSAISENNMPACFAASRALTVALARMLMTALNQNETMIEQLKPDSDDKPITH